MFTIKLINGIFIHFITEFSQTICLPKNSDRYLQFYTLNKLSVSLCKSAQFAHSWRKFHNRKRRFWMRKSCIKIPLFMKDQIYIHDCTKQTSKLPQLQNKDLNLLTINLHLLTEKRYIRSSVVNGTSKTWDHWLSMKRKLSWQSLNPSFFNKPVLLLLCLVFSFFSVQALFHLTRSLIDRC